MGRRGALALAAIPIVAVVLAGFGAVASTSSDESSFVSRINSERTSRGLQPLSVASDLVSVARNWSSHMASSQTISHDPNISNEVSNWTRLGDNVGRGPDVTSIHDAFMNSPEHRSNILDPEYTQIGVGVVAGSDDRLYVTEIFVRRATSRVTTHHRTTTTTARHTVSRPRTSASTANVASDIVRTGVVWEISLGPRAVTVSVLEELNGLDSPRVDPATGEAD
jgi:cysteine-rich secretory family protein